MLLLRYYKKDFEVQGIALLFNTSTTKPKDAIFRYKNQYLLYMILTIVFFQLNIIGSY